MDIVGTIIIIVIALLGFGAVAAFLMLLYAAMEMAKRGDINDSN
jgi:hypothetical protein